MKIVFFFFFLVHTTQSSSIKRQADSTGDRCVTPDGRPGDCRKTDDCPTLLNLLRSVTQEDINHVSNSICKFEGAVAFVCCPTTTPPSPVEIPTETSRHTDAFSNKSGGSIFEADRVVNGTVVKLGGLRRDRVQQFTGVNNNVDTLSAVNHARRTECAELQNENKQLKSELAELKSHVADLEQYSRRENLEIAGVPYTPRENLYHILDTIARTLNVRFSRSEISDAHRMPDYKKDGKPNIIVKFVSRSVKNEWMRAAKERRKLTAQELHHAWDATNVYINDHVVSPDNKSLLGHVRQLLREKKITGAWSRDCKIAMRVKADGPIYTVETMEDVQKVLKTK